MAITMANDSYPITTQKDAQDAWDLRADSKVYSEAAVVGHIRMACKKLGLTFPGPEEADREVAFDRMMQTRAHGFVYPSNLPACAQCGEGPNDGAHINPPRTGQSGLSYVGGERRVFSADQTHMRRPRRSHAYTTGYAGYLSKIPCQGCGQSMGAGCHTPGMPVASGTSMLPISSNPQGMGPQVARAAGEGAGTEKAFVTQVNGKVILTAPASVFTDPEGLPRELAAAWEKASAGNANFMWIEGRYVEADMPNRNNAAWSTEDLELGEPSIAHGPLNWLHEERHIIGTIAAAKLVIPERQAANEGSRAHIRSLAAVWRYLWPTEARQVAAASEDRRLWYSMECISREVACMAPDCTHAQTYRDYMLTPATRCEHVKAGGPRRFVDPSFLGGAVIIPPTRPGWGGANASVLRQAAALAEGHEDSLKGLTESEAVSMVAQIIRFSTEGATQ